MFTIIKNWLYRSLSLLLEKIGLRRLRHCPVGTLSTITHKECGVSTKREKMKINLNDVTNIDNLTTINANFDKIEQEFQNKVLYRDNPTGEPNTVEKDLDMNGKSLLNVGSIGISGELFAPIDAIQSFVDSAEDAAEAALVSENNAETAETNAESAAADTLAYYTSFAAKYLGAAATNPTVDALGNPVTAGASYFNTTTNQYRIYSGTVWTTPNIDATGLAATTGANLVGYNASNTYSPNTVGNALKNMEGSIVTTGSWTPNLKFGINNAGITYQYQNGTYVKIGKLVFISFRIELTNKGSSTGSAYITGLPFSFGGTGSQPGFTSGEFSSMAVLAANDQYGVSGMGSLNSLAVLKQDLSGNSSNPLGITNGSFNNNSVIHVSLSYITS